MSPLPDVGEMARPAAGDDEHRVDPDIVALAHVTLRQPLGGDCDAPQPVPVERERGCFLARLAPSPRRRRASGRAGRSTSTSPPGTRARRARMRQPCSRRYQQARVSAPRPRFSAAWRFTWRTARALGRRRACAACSAARRPRLRRARATACASASSSAVSSSSSLASFRGRRRADDDHDLALGRRVADTVRQAPPRVPMNAFLVELGQLPRERRPSGRQECRSSARSVSPRRGPVS